MARYTDFYLKFNIHPVSGDLALVSDAAAISSAIRNLVMTNRYERPFQPRLGAGVPASLFENANADTEYIIQVAIEEVIANYEKRATNVHVYVTTENDRNQYTATIVYTPINHNQPVTIETIFERIR